jgi:hypothetical protein
MNRPLYQSNMKAFYAPFLFHLHCSIYIKILGISDNERSNGNERKRVLIWMEARFSAVTTGS